MTDMERIQKMVDEKNISKEQAELLIAALKESQRKSDRIFKDVMDQKKRRQKQLALLAGVWLGTLFFVCAVFLLVVLNARVNKVQEKIDHWEAGHGQGRI